MKHHIPPLRTVNTQKNISGNSHKKSNHIVLLLGYFLHKLFSTYHVYSIFSIIFSPYFYRHTAPEMKFFPTAQLEIFPASLPLNIISGKSSCHYAQFPSIISQHFSHIFQNILTLIISRLIMIPRN